jgi:hypothetical protein
MRILLTIVISGALALISVLLTSDPSTQTLDTDLASIRRDVIEAQTESAKYQGGLLKGVIELRAGVLRSTEAMLMAKRASVLRRINLDYVVDGKHVTPVKLSDIEADISNEKSRITVAEQKAAQYSGGLVQAMALMSVATEQVTLAQLYLAYYSAKYDLPSVGAYVPHSVAVPRNPGNVVPDKEAL